MKKIVLKKMKIENFKNIALADIDFVDITNIVADVQQGKTSIKEAYIWAMGCEIDNFYPVDVDNKFIDDLIVKVSIDLAVDNINYSLSRSAKIKYKTNRDTNEKLFDGFKKDMFEFDGVPCGTTDFKNKLVSLLGIDNYDTFKFLTILNYFNEQVDWKTRRELIYNLFVDRTKIDNLKNSTKYDLLSNELLKGKTVAELSTMINSENNKLVDERRKNEILLADVKAWLSQNEKPNKSALMEELASIEENIESLSSSKSSARLDMLNKIEEINAKINTLNLEYNTKMNKNASDIIQEQSKVDMLSQKCLTIEKNIAVKTKAYDDIAKTKFDENSTICPLCHQTLPQAEIQAKITSWENDKQNNLNALKSAIMSLKNDLDNAKEKYLEAQYALQVKQDEKNAIENPTEQIEKLVAEKNKLTEEFNIYNQEDITKIKLDELKEKRANVLAMLGTCDFYEKQVQKHAMLINENIELVNSDILLAKKRHQLEQYKLDIIDLVNDEINANFVGVKFKLFEILTATAKSDIKETLIVLNNGVEYGACSTGQKAETNLIIVSTLQGKFNISLPIWVDDASITNITNVPNNQMIFLYNEKGAKLDIVKIRDI